ncbi:SHOCT domain-containing protein [Weissella paramesenteroides]|uniref:SHOCT domain-containing protein n=1 Tax=Weissella paramesenteroides TaxID=1249 RepID=UPI001C1F505A|nr:SHOCT domain-containing protein [Weissella paramesenteroides]MBU7556848.1 SHOCT domain-containing protein [Weissella paramesenteroides]
MKYDDLKSLKELLDENLITEEEYQIQKAHILGLPVKSEKEDSDKVINDNEDINPETDVSTSSSDEDLEIKNDSDDTSHQSQDTTNEEVTAKEQPIVDEVANNQVISRVEAHDTGHFKNVVLIILMCIIVFIIGCILGYYIFK